MLPVWLLQMREKGQNVNMQNYVLPTTGAKNNEDNGLGPFQGYNPVEVETKKAKIDGLLNG